MSRMQPLRRVAFREAVNFPGDEPGNPFKLESPETVFPKGGAQSATMRRQHAAFFSDGFVILENCQSKNRTRVPMSNVKALTFEEDVPKGAEP